MSKSAFTGEEVPCLCCGRLGIKKIGELRNPPRPGGKAHVRHKCPHGRWCRSGIAGKAKLNNTGYNSAGPYCYDCEDAKRASQGLPAVKRPRDSHPHERCVICAKIVPPFHLSKDGHLLCDDRCREKYDALPKKPGAPFVFRVPA